MNVNEKVNSFILSFYFDIDKYRESGNTHCEFTFKTIEAEIDVQGFIKVEKDGSNFKK